MANKNDNYYLINGDEFVSNVLYIPYKGTYYKNVKDISDMDLATLEYGTDLRQTLADCNPTVRLGNQFYIGKYPYSKGIKIFKPIEVFYSSMAIQKNIDIFREIAEERNFNYHNDKKLELTSRDKVMRLVEQILDELTPKQKQEVFSDTSILGLDVKRNRISNKHLFDEQISNYTQLRNLLINYLFIKGGRALPTNFRLKAMSDSLQNIKGLYQENPDEIKRALEEYKEAILRAKNEEEMKKAAERLITDPNVQYDQMTLFDMTQDPALKFLDDQKKLNKKNN